MVLVPNSGPALLAERPAKQAWLAAGCALALAAVALCILFAREARGAFDVWMTSTAYNHCFLIVPVALYLAWKRRGALAGVAVQPDLRFLALLLPMSVLWLGAALMSVLEVQQLIVMAMFEIIALAILGWRAYRAMWVPLLYLFFLVPTGYFLVPKLQDFTAWFAVAGLRLVGIPVYSDGTLIEVPAGSFVVAEACAGLRFLIASVAFGAFFSAFMYRSSGRALAFIALCIVVPIIANGLRAFGIIALAEALGSATAVEADHIIYGWVFFSAVTLLLIWIGMRFAQDTDPAATAPGVHPGAPAARPWRVALAAAIGLALVATAPAYAQFRDWRGAAISLANAPAPPLAAGWSPAEQPMPAWRPVVQSPDGESLGSFTDGTNVVTRYVGLYETEGFHNNLVRATTTVADDKHWHRVSSEQVQAQIDGHARMVDATEISRDGHRLLVWDFYLVGGKVAASPMQAKLAQLRELFGPPDGVDAFVAVAADADGAQPPAQVLQSFLTAMGPLRSYLASLKPQR